MKGVGEAGTIAGTPAIVNAVTDALRPLGVTYMDTPLTSMRVWEYIQAAKGAGDGPRASEQGRALGDQGEASAGSGPSRPPGGRAVLVIPPEFDYAVPESLEEAISLLASGGQDAKLLAGGHSLVPLMKLRLAAPSLLVDLRKVPGLHGVQRENGTFRIGAMTTHATLETTSELSLLAEVAGTIADQQVRNRGTIGGSLAHGDPASDFPAVVMAAGGAVTVQGPNGQREIHARDLFQDYLTTAIEPDEVMTEIRVEALAATATATPS